MTELERPELITIEGLTKVFFTDEIETHALSGVHLSIARGEYLAMSGPSLRQVDAGVPATGSAAAHAAGGAVLGRHQRGSAGRAVRCQFSAVAERRAGEGNDTPDDLRQDARFRAGAAAGAWLSYGAGALLQRVGYTDVATRHGGKPCLCAAVRSVWRHLPLHVGQRQPRLPRCRGN